MRALPSVPVVVGVVLVIAISPCFSAEQPQPSELKKQNDSPERLEKHVYKQTPQADLEIFIHLPNDWQQTDNRPAIVFFFGGAFRTGRIDEFMRHAKYFASRGMVAARADYRVKDRHGTMPDKCVEDAKSAVRWLRTSADKFGIDPNRIAASGHSAGGHISACASTTIGLEAEGEDLSISSKPNLLVLFNSSLDINWKYGRYLGSKETVKHLSPIDNLTPDLSPTILFYGVEDTHLMHGLAFAYKSGILGSTVELYAAQGLWHNDSKYSPWFENTLYLMDQFLANHEYLADEPTISLPQEKVEISRMTSKDLSLMDSINHTPLHVAATTGDIKLTQSLIADGIDVNGKDRWGTTALYLATWESGDLKVVQALIDAGADLNVVPLWGEAPLHYAVRYGHTELATLLISNGADVNISMGGKRLWTPLHIAIQQGNRELAELLLVQGASVHSSGYLGQTPIETAMQAKRTKIEIVELLLSNGAEIPPLHLALYSKDQAKVKDLIQAGANVNEQTPYGTTPLHRAINYELSDIVLLLIENGANVNTKDNWGWAPLHTAVFRGKHMVRMLVSRNVNIHVKDGDNRTPLSYAEEKGYSEIVEILTKAAKEEKDPSK